MLKQQASSSVKGGHSKARLAPRINIRNPIKQAAKGPSKPSAAPSVSLLLIETNSFIMGGLISFLQSTRFQVLTSAPSFGSLPQAIGQPPEIVLIGSDSAAEIEETLKDCKTRFPSARRVVLHECKGEQLLMMLQAGANSCLGRSVTSEALLMTLNLTMQGATIISCPLVPLPGEFLGSSSQVSCVAPENERRTSDFDQTPHRLSVREISILECLVHGDSNKLIARKFQIAEATVKVHVKAILRKIRAANRTQAAIWAMNNLSLARNELRPPAHLEVRP